MLQSIFQGLFDSELTNVISITDFLICVGASLLIGLLLALVYMHLPDIPKALLSHWRFCRQLSALSL